MAKLRPARCYRKLKGKAYTRTAKRVVKKAFVRGVPNIKIVKYDLGTSGTYEYRVDLISKEKLQIRHNAIEACRILLQRDLQKTIGRENYHFQVRLVPHHVMRENAIISGAGADRLQTGMKHAFGRPVGKAARVKRGQIMFSVKVHNKKDIDTAKLHMKKIIGKLPTKCSFAVTELKPKQQTPAKKEAPKVEA